jgi:hypothetical protein
MSQDDWVENELNNKKDIIADLRERIDKEREIQDQLKQALTTG